MDRSEDRSRSFSRHRSKNIARSNLNVYARIDVIQINEYFDRVTTGRCNLIKIESFCSRENNEEFLKNFQIFVHYNINYYYFRSLYL